ncbi:MAG: T9SS type A sorting domain-containing protein [Bacteroidetes bacterium]|nr:T9SS type A sorting domain-containing protein [Bacteroidota bacterium]
MSIRLLHALSLGWVFVAPLLQSSAAQNAIEFDVPPRKINHRFFKDQFVTQRPALTFNGFSCERAKVCHHGLGVVEFLGRVMGRDPDKQLLEYLGQLLLWSKKDLWAEPSDRQDVIENTGIVQARATIALIWIVLEGSGVEQRPFLKGAPTNASEAVRQLFHTLEDLNVFRIRKSMTEDAVKWVVPIANLARTLDLYLALENAISYYPSVRFTEPLPALLSCSEKSKLLSFVADEVEHLDDLGNEPVLLGIKRDEIQSGNWPMKVHLAVAYGSLSSQTSDENSCEPVPNYSYTHWLERGLRSAGAPTKQNRSKHWNYQTDSGSRFFAEGPYYFHLTLSEVIPFWHAIRVNGLIGSHPDFDLDDPFFSSWFTDPLEWLADIVTPGGTTLPFDDGNRVFMGHADLLRWDATYGLERLGRKFAWIADQKNEGNPNNANLLPLFLAIPAVGWGEGTEPIARLGKVLDFEGPRTHEQIALMRRSTIDSMGRKSEHFVAMNGEFGDSIRRGEGHEQADQLQLVYYVGDVGVLIDSGYDHAYGLGNSTWNHYYDHNVLTISNGFQTLDGGLPAPVPSLFATRIISTHADAHYLGQYSKGRIDVLRGVVDLKLTNSFNGAPDARYLRYSLLVGDPEQPYLIDVNRGVSRDSRIEFKMRYHVRGDPFSYQDLNYKWRSKRTDESIIETRISAFRTDGPLDLSVQHDTGMEHLRELETIGRLDLEIPHPSLTFSSVALISTGDPDREVMVPKPLSMVVNSDANSNGDDDEVSAYSWAPDHQVVDVLLLSFSSRLSSLITLELSGQPVNLTFHANSDVGFIRLRYSSTGEWRVEPEYVYNITSDLRPVGTDTFSAIELSDLIQIHPNPVRETAEIEFRVEVKGTVRLSIYDSQGREVAVLVDSMLEPGLHRSTWSSSMLASGVYFLRITNGGRHETKPFVIKR